MLNIEQHEAPSQRRMYSNSTASKEMKVEEPAVWGKIPESEYISEYGKLKPVTTETNAKGQKIGFYKRVFANGPATHANPLVNRRALEMFPGLWSFDAMHLKFLRELSAQLNDALPVGLDDDGFTTNGVHATFDRLRCPAGYYMNPMSYVPTNNEAYREELGLPNGFIGDQEAIAREVWTLVWSHAKVSAVNVAKLSTGGMRRFSRDTQWKLAYAEWLMEPERFERYLNAVDSGDWLELANEYETVFAMYLQKRGQTDPPGKERLVFDLEYAMSGGKKGKAFPADKSVLIDGIEYPDFSALRARVVQAGPWVVNCYLQIAATCAMKALFELFPSTFHVNTKEEIKEQIDGKYIYASDVKEYDRSMGREDIWIAHEVMKEFWDERIVKASWRLFTSPYYSKPLDISGKAGVWVGDPTDWNDEIIAGNRSGHAMTSLFAKVNKFIDSLGTINRIYPVVGRCKAYASGSMTMGVVNNGDDEVTWAQIKSDIAKFRSLRENTKLGRYHVSPEEGQGYSGLLIMRDPANETVYNPVPRLLTPFEKTYCNERSIGGEHRPFWPIGQIDRISNLTATREGSIAWEIHNRLYRDMLAPEIGDFMTVLMRSYDAMPIQTNGFTARDREVLDDPTKIHYKYTDDEISDVVLDQVTSKIPIELVERIVTRYYRGNLL